MKRVRIITAAAILFVSLASFANGPVGKNSHGVVKNIIDVDLDPTFRKKGDKLYMNLLNLDQEKVTIKVYDGSGRIVYKETFENSLVIEKAFNFEKAFEDDYTVVVFDDNKKFKEVVVVE